MRDIDDGLFFAAPSRRRQSIQGLLDVRDDIIRIFDAY
jgi:hypothetical protein